MINIKIGNEYLEMPPNTKIKRERNSPFFLVKKSNGNDGIPGEISTPFNLPLTNHNMRMLGYPDHMPTVRGRSYDIILSDDTTQVSAGKMQLLDTQLNLNANNQGMQQVHVYSNASSYFKLIEGKKLRDLSLGGPRTFAWDGFNATSGNGLWRHLHQTWDYQNCDDGDYVFFPVYNPDFAPGCMGMNEIVYDGISLPIINSSPVSICPHTYVLYVLKSCFNEFGYNLEGEILEDEMLKKLCLLSFTGIDWSNKKFTLNEEVDFDPAPYTSCTFRLNEHMPPDVTIAEFLVAFCKFLPIGMDINDGTRTCTLRLLGRPSPTQFIKDITGMVSPVITASTGGAQKDKKVAGIKRNFGTDGLNGGAAYDENMRFATAQEIPSLPLPGGYPAGTIFKVVNENAFYSFQEINSTLTTVRLGDNLADFSPQGATEFVECNMVPVSTRVEKAINASTNTNFVYDIALPCCGVPGNWKGKADISRFGMHVVFYQGREWPWQNSNTFKLPYASSTNNKWVPGPAGKPVPEIHGTWSMAYELANYGMADVWWKPWLKVLAEAEIIKTRLHMPLHKYMQLNWADELLIENTSYILKKINEELPYTENVEIEAVRWFKENT